MENRAQIIAGVVVIIVALFAIARVQNQKTSSPQTSPEESGMEVQYVCNAGKSIQAVFYRGESKPVSSPGEPPVPGGSVDIVLSDGRSFKLVQTISADGVRYANADESFVFWGKGSGAFVLENNQEKSYIGCIEVAQDPGGLTKVYQNGRQGFSLRYPAGFTVDEKYRYSELGPGKEIVGVKFMISESMATGTNLGSDSYISVEQKLRAPSGLCTARLFLDLSNGAQVKPLEENGVTYSFASSTGAGLGNRYEESVYVFPDTNPCVAVRYFVHYSAIENYEPGMVREFDKAALLREFNKIRKTLMVNQ